MFRYIMSKKSIQENMRASTLWTQSSSYVKWR